MPETLIRKDIPPTEHHIASGLWAYVVVCEKCGLRSGIGNYMVFNPNLTQRPDMHNLQPCPECGGQLHNTVGAWNRKYPKWKFWKKEGRWVIREEPEWKEEEKKQRKRFGIE